MTLWKVTEHERRQAQLRVGDRLCADAFGLLSAPSAEEIVLAFAPLEMLRLALAKLEDGDG